VADAVGDFFTSRLLAFGFCQRYLHGLSISCPFPLQRSVAWRYSPKRFHDFSSASLR
jgi:hypothetical protein